MTTTLVLTSELEEELRSVASLTLETGGVLLASAVETTAGVRLLAREIRWVDESAYDQRESTALSIRSEGYVYSLGEAERLKAVPIWLHTHPGVGSSPRPSRYDKIVDGEIADLFRLRSGSAYYASLIVAPTDVGITFWGQIQSDRGAAVNIDRMWIVGDRFRLIPSFESNAIPLSNAFDRNVRAFGPVIQDTLRSLRVGIVGCGGTGSAVAEQLVRLGVRKFTLVDPEELAESNVTRLYGSSPSQIGVPKVDIVAENIRFVAPDAEVTALKSTVLVECVARSLTECDVLFGCTDDNAGRLVLSRLAAYFLMPVIDCGVLLSATDDSSLVGIDGRVTTLVPGQACLVCRGRIDLARAATEVLTPEERVRRADEGYAPILGKVEPAVVAFTTAVAAAAVSELLERLIGYGPDSRPSEVLLRLHDREISTNRVSPREGHYCASKGGKLGTGITTPFLDQVWQA